MSTVLQRDTSTEREGGRERVERDYFVLSSEVREDIPVRL